MRKLAAELEAALRRAGSGGRDARVTIEPRGRAGTAPRRETAPRATDIPRRAALDVQAVVDEMNLYRRQHGLAPLVRNPALELAASDRIDDMFTRRYFDHVSPDGVQPFARARSRGYRWSMIGENLAEGQRSAREVVADWMQSPGHRANILGSTFEECGVAIAEGSPVRQSRGYTFVAFYATPRQ